FLLVLGLIRRRSTDPAIRGAAGLLTIAVLARGFAIRPQIFSSLGIATTLWLLDKPERRGATWLMIPLLALWAHVHGGFVLGLSIFALFTGAELLRNIGQPRAMRLRPWIAAGAAAAATTLNPYGPHLLVYILNELTRPHLITEWQPVAPSDVAHFAFL